MELTTRRRRALSTALALVLAIESVSAVAAVAQVTRTTSAGARHALPADAPAGAVLAERDSDESVAAVPLAAVVAGPSRTAADLPSPVELQLRPRTTAPARVASPAAPRPARAAAPTIQAATAKTTSKSSTTRSSGTKSTAAKTYRGRNHVWIPSLRINRSVSWFPCDRQRPPDNYVYRWGCAGANNVYLMGHAYSVFKPLHDAYVSGRLRKGMKAYYADAKGKVHLYTVRWWKLTRPTTAASWAWAGQSVPSMTLQTCVGRNSEYRLMVRLVEVR